jgi:hypothetical protein
MISIGLSAADQAKFTSLLRSAHFLGVVVRLLDLDHNYREDLTAQFMEGNVSIDVDADVTRGLDVTFLDPQKQISIDPDSPSPTSIYVAQMLSVVMVYLSPTRDFLVNVPVFTGPIDSVDRDDVFLQVKCLGKESLSIQNLWSGKTYAKGQRKTDVIRSIFRDLIGETKLDLINDPATLPNDLKLNRDDAPFMKAKDLAGSMGYQLFYDGRGVARMRKRNNNVVFTLDKTWLTDQPQASYDLQETINAVDVKGHKPKKGKDAPRAKAIADYNHPLSPWRLGRAGVPRYLWTEVEDDSLRSDAECAEVANRILKRGLLAGVEVQAEGIPHPQLEEEDIIHYATDHFNATAMLKKFTIPLEAGENSTYGYHEKTKVKGGHKGVKRKNKKHKGGKGKKNNHKNPHKGAGKGGKKGKKDMFNNQGKGGAGKPGKQKKGGAANSAPGAGKPGKAKKKK